MVLGYAVVVGEDRGGADVGVRADVRVAHVRQVRHLGALADHGVLHLDVAAGPCARPQLRAGPEVGERADAGTGPDLGRLADRVDHGRARSDHGVAEHTARADAGAGADRGAALDVRARADLRVGLGGRVHAEPGGRRVHDRHARAHPPFEQAVVVHPPGPGQLHPVVDALDLGGVGREHGADAVTVTAQDDHHVGQVLLTLRVAGRHPLDRVGEQGAVERVAAGVDLVDPALLLGGVRLLDDLGHGTGGVPDDAAVAGRVAGPGGQHGHDVAGGLVLAGQRVQV